MSLVKISDDAYIETDYVDIVRIARAHGDNAQLHEIQVWIGHNCVTTGDVYAFAADGKEHEKATRDMELLIERIRAHQALTNLGQAVADAERLVRELESVEKLI